MLDFLIFCDIITFAGLNSPAKNEYPGVAQLGARLTGGQEAVSSSLATRTILMKAEIVDIQRFQLFTFLQKSANGPYLVLILKNTKSREAFSIKASRLFAWVLSGIFMSDFCPINNHKADPYQSSSYSL